MRASPLCPIRLMVALAHLNPQQAAAVRHLGTPLLVLAGAGSGKTRVITHKIAWLIEDCGIPAERVLAVTFTNKAAREMRERALALCPGRAARGLTVCTFHALGLQILRRELRAAGLRPGFSVVDGQDSLHLIRELAQAGEELDAEAARAIISAWKDAGIAPEQALRQATDDREMHFARIYDRYERQLRAYNAVDFDDLIALPVRVLHGDRRAREHWQARTGHLLIDEYQDTSAAQYALMRLLVGSHHGLTAVGDDDQSVYAWRGARPENLQRLKEDFPQLQVIKLEQNYRSTGHILAAANGLIARNPHLFEKRLWSSLGPGDPIRVLPCNNPEHEAERIVSDMLRLRLRHADSWSHYAVLYRSNHQSRPLEQALREHGIPYRVSGGTSFFAYAEIKDLLAYLRLLSNPEDDPAFLRVVNVPRRHIGPGTVKRLATYAAERRVPLLQACGELGLASHLPAAGYRRLTHFAQWLIEAQRLAHTEGPLAIFDHLLRSLDYEAWLRETSSGPAQAERRIARVGELRAWIARMADPDTGDGKDLDAITGHLALVDLMERQGEERAADSVQLMTLHAAKGLEFPHVWIAGLEEAILPHHANLEGAGLEEERRLAYVGLTRAQRHLTLTYCAQRNKSGETVDCEPSRFLRELPPDTVDWVEPSSPAAQAQARETGRAHLDNLRSLLQT